MNDNDNNVTHESIPNNQELLREDSNKKNRKNISIIIIVIVLIIAMFVLLYLILFKDKGTSSENVKSNNNKYSAYRISDNSLDNFDLYFLQLENEKMNKVYSPLSIKYALKMLEDGANGESKEQISNITGTYTAKKYANSENMSFANALFIRDSYKNSIKDAYINNLSTKYNAEVVYDSFTTPDVLNSWTSNKTFKLIDNIADDISNQNFILVNALAIDMEWVNKIQDETENYKVDYEHEKFYKYIGSLNTTDYHGLDFKDVSYKVKSAEIGAAINKYDIVNALGEDNIRETVGKEYEKWLAAGACGNPEEEPDTNTYLNNYIKEINSGYKQLSSSTDFTFYDDDDVKVFAKDLKEYDGTTLQYISIMPKNDTLDNYIKNIKAETLNTLINNLKSIELENFKEGVITEISGYIPMFKFDYELNLINDLNKLGITDVFESDKANLSNLSSSNAFINQASHKANIEFSNEGIKASAVTSVGGVGSADCGFDYQYEVPIEKIDLTFDNPYLFIVRDKDTGEVWFTGTVYEPIEYHSYYEQYTNQ